MVFNKFNRGSRTETADELGFGSKYADDSSRIINKDGTFNINKIGSTYHLYHDLIQMPWQKFLTLVFLFYLGLNTFFAFLFLVIGAENIAEAKMDSFMDKFFSAFFLSAQTLTTVGFGFYRPIGYYANMLASFEAFFGLLCFALATGLLYGRFSKPEGGIVFTKNALITPFKSGFQSLQFRIANRHDSSLIELEAKLIFTILENHEGVVKRGFYRLNLESNEIYFLSMNWTLVHSINEESPMYGLSKEDLLERKAEILVLIKSFNESFSQVVHSRTSYSATEFLWNHKFVLPYTFDDKMKTIFDLKRLNETIPI